jgi:hypothetical protein
MGLLLYAFLVVVVAAVLIALLNWMPAGDEQAKRFGRWVIIVIAAIVLLTLVLRVIGVEPIAIGGP